MGSPKLPHSRIADPEKRFDEKQIRNAHSYLHRHFFHAHSLFPLAAAALLGLICAPFAFAQTGATIASPVAGNVLTGSSATFSWPPVSSATGYWLSLGTTGKQTTNVYSSGPITGTSVTVTGIPTDGVTLYATLSTQIGGIWTQADSTYTEAGKPVLAAITSPTPGSTLAGTSVTFKWSAGAGPTGYWLVAGTTGPGSTNLYDAGGTNTTSATVTGVPANGDPVYVTLFSQISGVWKPVNYVFAAPFSGSPVPAAITTPASGSVLSGSSATFTWTQGQGVMGFWLYIGTTGALSSNIYNSKALTGTSLTVSGLPMDGVPLYVTLYSEIEGKWQPQSYTYTEAGSPTLAALTSPAPGSTLLGSSATFKWSAGAGPSAYWLYIGTTAGAANLYNSGGLSSTSVAVAGLPTKGATIYITLFSDINGSFQPVRYTLTEAGPPAPAAMSSPSSGSVLSGASTTFSWTPGKLVTSYWLDIGTAAASSNIYSSGALSGTSVTVSGIPANGVTLYVTLFSKINGVYQPAYYTYSETGTPVLAAMTSPPTGGVLLGSTLTFSWSAGGGPSAYWLNVGTTGAGSHNIYDSGAISATSATVTGLPAPGATVYVTLFSEINGVFKPVYYTYTLASPIVSLSWAPPSGTGFTITGYNVYRTPSGTSNYVPINAALDTSTSYTDNSVSAGVAYDYYIESVDSAGAASAPSAILPISVPTFLP